MKASKIPILVPDMPQTSDLIPYLNIIDNEKRYSNFGQLHSQLIQRLASYFSVDQQNVTLVSNATLAIAGALSYLPRQKNQNIECPSFTFSASPSAIITSGHSPFFVDIDEQMRMEPTGDSKFVLDVLPFGESLRIQSWYEQFDFVVIDAAASFDSLQNFGNNFKPDAQYAIVVSLHATKLMGAGEGGVVISNSPEVIEFLKHWSNFGFSTFGSIRRSEYFGTNAKMSEYSCAVALASLDRWNSVRNDYLRISKEAKRISSLGNFEIHNAMKEGFATPYWIILHADPARITSVKNILDSKGVETRHWWDKGCHTMPAYSDVPRAELERTEYLATRYLGLPFHNFLSNEQWKLIYEAIKE